MRSIKLATRGALATSLALASLFNPSNAAQASDSADTPPFLHGAGEFGVNYVDTSEIMPAGAIDGTFRPHAEYKRTSIYHENSRSTPYYANDPFYSSHIFNKADEILATTGRRYAHFELWSQSNTNDAIAPGMTYTEGRQYLRDVYNAYKENFLGVGKLRGWKCYYPTLIGDGLPTWNNWRFYYDVLLGPSLTMDERRQVAARYYTFRYSPAFLKAESFVCDKV